MLNNEHISDDEYKHAQIVWNKFDIKNMGQYHDLYLKSGILLLSDDFENFRKTCTTKTVLQSRSRPLFYISWTQLGRNVKVDKH